MQDIVYHSKISSPFPNFVASKWATTHKRIFFLGKNCSTRQCLYINCAFADSKIQSSTDKCIFRYRQSSVRWLLPGSKYRRAHGNQIIEHSSDNKTVFGRSRKLGGAAAHLTDGSEKRICWLNFEF